MKRLVLLMLACLLPMVAQAQLKVFACEPEWSSLARELGGDLVETSSATHALQDPHFIQARPSLISRLRKADLLICTGAGLEAGWLPKLLEKANNRQVRPGSAGYFEAGAQVRRLDVPAVIDRAQGDVHPQGNPHVQMHPENIRLIAIALGARMAELDPANHSVYRDRTEDFDRRWSQAMERWEARGSVLSGARIIVHHRSWVYLEDWLGLINLAALEPVSGVPPTATHLAGLLQRFGTDGQGADVIIRAPYQDAKASDWLSQKTGVATAVLPMTVGGTEAGSDLFGLFDEVLERLLAATGKGGAR